MIKQILYACSVIVILVGCARASKNMDAEMRLNINHYKVPCAGESVELCFVIKKDNGEKEFFYDDIEGFDFKWGYNYTISVEKKASGAIRADASSMNYKLIKIIKKEKVLAGVEFELPVKFNDQTIVENDNGVYSYFNEIKIQASSHSFTDLVKAESAIFRYSPDSTRLVLVRFK